jgi:hypothetical protein
MGNFKGGAFTFSGTVGEPSKVLMKTAPKADSGTPQPIARNPAVSSDFHSQARPGHTCQAPAGAAGKLVMAMACLSLTFVGLGGVDDAVLVPVEEGGVLLQRRQLVVVHVRHGRPLLLLLPPCSVRGLRGHG